MIETLYFAFMMLLSLVCMYTGWQIVFRDRQWTMRVLGLLVMIITSTTFSVSLLILLGVR